MDNRRKFIIVGCSPLGSAIRNQLEKLGDVVMVTPEQAEEQGLTPIGTSFQQRTEDLLITPDTVTISKTPEPPLSRRERRKQERRKHKTL